MESQNLYYVKQPEGVRQGPWAVTAILAMYRNGAISSDSVVCKEDSEEWAPVSSLLPQSPDTESSEPAASKPRVSIPGISISSIYDPGSSESETPERPTYEWNLMNAFLTCIKRCTRYSGRASRAEFWFSVLGLFLIQLGLFLVSLFVCGVAFFQSVFGDSGTTGYTILGYFLLFLRIALLLPLIASISRRLHDVGICAWVILVGLIPAVGPIILVVLCCLESAKGSNRYGDGPDGPA